MTFPLELLKKNSNVFSNILYAAINSSKKSLFPAFLKTDYLIPVYKKEKRSIISL